MTDTARHSQHDKNWPKDEFGRHEAAAQWFFVFGVPLAIAALALIAATLFSINSWLEGKTADEVIVYCAQDQTYAEPILRQFEEETGIRVRSVYDSEAVKTVGLANRLLAERDHPQCDLFWGNEEMRTRQLATLNVWRKTNGWSAFGARARCLVVNTNLVTPASIPRSLLDLTNARWQGKVAMAFPQFGTTATHFHVLRQYWGEDLWQQWCRGLVHNDAKVVDGNSTVVKLVGREEAWIGLTDTDDVAAGQREGLPVERGPSLTGTSLFIPNTVAIVRGAPHPESAQKLAEYLQRPETVRSLLEAGAIQYAEVPTLDHPVLEPDWNRLLQDMESTSDSLNQIFLR